MPRARPGSVPAACFPCRVRAGRGLAAIAGALSLWLAAGAHAEPYDEPNPSEASALSRVDAAPKPNGRASWKIGRTTDVFDGEGWATRVGGWVDASYQDNDADGPSSLNINHFNLYFDTRFRAANGMRWQAFLETEFENEPEARGFEGEREYEVEQAYLRFTASDTLNLRLGRFNTPFGIWTPLHWLILMDTITEPIHEGTRVTPEQQMGAELSGRIFLDEWLAAESELSYSLYAGYGNDSELFDESSGDGFSIGSDIRLRLSERSLFGLSSYRQRRDEESLTRRTELGFMAYGELHPLRPLTLRFEIFRQLRDHDIGPGLSRNINIGYIKARWDFSDRLYSNYRFNYGDDEQLGTSDDRQTHTFTLGYRPTPSLRLKLEYANTEFRRTRREDFSFFGVSIGALF